MRSIWRTLDRGLARDIGLVCLADCLVGVSYGAIAVSSGFPLWLPMLMSLLVFAGASQFMFIGIVAAGGNPFAAVLAGLLANTRHLPFGFAIGDVLGKRWPARLAGSHLMVDEAVAFALAQQEMHRRRAAYWACGLGLFACWNVGVVAGAFAGSAISDTDVFGLDAAFPAVLLALVLPSLRDRAVRLPVLAGVVVALATTPFLPAGLPVLLALAGVLAGVAAKEPEPEEAR
ncbi:AzlC family ABC transporter permease [Amycolatopsis sp. NPDC051758]|uniref:AzlC family ABC transporter permease n=1 Tax=Amycolatopsis sp. NPDC051758 TaxID=3363935 RepID=UPI0037A29B7C